jgi:hypothetical protein
MEREHLIAAVREGEVMKFCRDLVRINSVNPPGDELRAVGPQKKTIGF